MQFSRKKKEICGGPFDKMHPTTKLFFHHTIFIIWEFHWGWLNLIFLECVKKNQNMIYFRAVLNITKFVNFHLRIKKTDEIIISLFRYDLVGTSSEGTVQNRLELNYSTWSECKSSSRSLFPLAQWYSRKNGQKVRFFNTCRIKPLINETTMESLSHLTATDKKILSNSWAIVSRLSNYSMSFQKREGWIGKSIR